MVAGLTWIALMSESLCMGGCTTMSEQSVLKLVGILLQV